MTNTDLTKRPVVFIHGAWHGGWCWDRWNTIFKREHYANTIAVELRGHGYKTGSFKHARLENYVDDVKTIINELETEPILVGHSLGCTIIQYLCSQKQFPAAVMLAPVPAPKMFRRVFLHQISRHPFMSLRSTMTRTMKPWVTSKSSAKLFFSSSMPTQEAEAYTNRMQGESFRLFILDLLRSTPKVKPGTPTLVVAAQADRFFKVADQRRMAQNLDADFLLARNSGHDVMLDVASQETAEEVIAWLNASV